MSPQLSLHLPPQAIRYSSANFIVHEGVRAAVEAVVTLGLAGRFAVVYIQGARLSGKTHLGVYLAGALRERIDHVRFIAGDSGGLQWLQEELPRVPIRPGEGVFIDDADAFLSATEGTGLFGDLVERVHSAQGLLVLLGTAAATALTTDPYVKSRLAAGVTLFLGAPRESDLDRLLDAVVRQRGLQLTEAKRSFILKRIPRTLEAVVRCAERLESAGEDALLSTSFEVLAGVVSSAGA